MKGLSWIVARTKPCRESWAAENVHRQGGIFYLPKVLTQRKKTIIAEPLFRSYLFVQVPSNDWHFLLTTFGISGLITFLDNPATIPDQEITKLKSREVNGFVVLPDLQANQRFKMDEKVRVKGGVFSGCTGIYKGQDTKQRERILLSLLGRMTPTLISSELLEAA